MFIPSNQHFFPPHKHNSKYLPTYNPYPVIFKYLPIGKLIKDCTFQFLIRRSHGMEKDNFANQIFLQPEYQASNNFHSIYNTSIKSN